VPSKCRRIRYLIVLTLTVEGPLMKIDKANLACGENHYIGGVCAHSTVDSYYYVNVAAYIPSRVVHTETVLSLALQQ